MRSLLSASYWLRLLPCLAWCLVIGLPLQRATAQDGKSKDEFTPLVKLAPFQVNGQSLAISIYARSNSDRRYGEQFAERVAKVVHEAVSDSTGRGLLIIGAKGEPHPILVFRKFIALAAAGKLDPAVAGGPFERVRP